jgi:hypothetical protein
MASGFRPRAFCLPGSPKAVLVAQRMVNARRFQTDSSRTRLVQDPPYELMMTGLGVGEPFANNTTTMLHRGIKHKVNAFRKMRILPGVQCQLNSRPQTLGIEVQGNLLFKKTFVFSFL